MKENKYPARQCPGCSMWFYPQSHNTICCTLKCSTRIKQLRRKITEPAYAAPPPRSVTAPVPAPPLPVSIPTATVAQVAAAAAIVNVSAEDALAALGYTSQPQGADRLECGHRDIGVHPCPLCEAARNPGLDRD